MGPTIAIVAGESSGDRLGAPLIEYLKQYFPEARFEGVGGVLMSAQGLDSVFPLERLSVMGIVPILLRIPELLWRRWRLVRRWRKQPPAIFIGIDAPEFNLGLEKALKAAGIVTVHFVSPTIWAWRPGRIETIRAAAAHVLTLFPFEQTLYRKAGIAATCVGHPMATEILTTDPRELCRERLRIEQDVPVLGLFPGSRGSEIRFLAPLFLAVAAELAAGVGRLKLVLAIANERCGLLLRALLKQQFSTLDVQLVETDSRTVIGASDVVLLASGTVTLETALLRRPMVVAYRVSAFSYAIFSRLSVLQHYALPNLLMSKPLIPEFIQDQATQVNLVNALRPYFGSDKSVPMEQKVRQQELLECYAELHRALDCGGSARAAEVIRDLIDGEPL